MCEQKFRPVTFLLQSGTYDEFQTIVKGIAEKESKGTDEMTSQILQIAVTDFINMWKKD